MQVLPPLPTKAPAECRVGNDAESSRDRGETRKPGFSSDGRALGLEPRGRRFEACIPDQPTPTEREQLRPGKSPRQGELSSLRLAVGTSPAGGNKPWQNKTGHTSQALDLHLVLAELSEVNECNEAKPAGCVSGRVLPMSLEAFTYGYDADDNYVRTGVTIWPPPTAHTSAGTALADMSFRTLRGMHVLTRQEDNPYFRRSLALELYRKNPRPPAFASLWTRETGWTPCHVG